MPDQLQVDTSSLPAIEQPRIHLEQTKAKFYEWNIPIWQPWKWLSIKSRPGLYMLQSIARSWSLPNFELALRDHHSWRDRHLPLQFDFARAFET